MAKCFLRTCALVLLLGLGASLLSACNTIEGIGEDISALGRGLSRAGGDKER
jgi:predicted small secreted protein